MWVMSWLLSVGNLRLSTKAPKFNWSKHKFTIEPPNEQGAIPFLDTFQRPSGNNNKIITSVYRKPTHMDRYLDFNSNHPKSAKCAVVRALTERVKNVRSSPELLAEEMDHLGKVLWYNNYPKWMIDQHGGNNSPEGRLINLKTGNEVKKSIFISAPYFPGLSESFEQLFKYTPIQVCFKGQNTIKLMLMHPKDKVDPSLKKDIVYPWSCTKPIRRDLQVILTALRATTYFMNYRNLTLLLAMAGTARKRLFLVQKK